MAIKLTCYFIISITVFFSKCSAVIVTVDDIVNVVEGNETRIMCNIVRSSSSSVAIPTVTWINVTDGVTDTIAQFQGGLGSVRSSYIDRFSVEGDTTLLIANTSRRDSGTYQCRVSITDDDPSPASDDIMLSVVYLDDVMININSNTFAENVTITCSANGSPLPIINLTKDDDVIKTENNAVLTYEIDNVTQSDGGSYKCTASNSVGSKHSRTIVLNYFKPEVTLDKEVVTIVPGGSNTITAKVSANPNDITYKWTIDPENNDITISNDEVTDTDPFSSTITIMASESAEDSTEYTVTVGVTNNIGSATQQANINVMDPCHPNPCKNGGTCSIDGAGGHKCDCRSGYTGMNCEDVWVIVVIVVCCVGGCGGVGGGGYYYYRVKVKVTVKKSNTGESSITATVKGVAVKGGTSDGVEVVAGAASVTITKENDLVRYEAESGAVYTQVNLKGKNADNESKKPAPVNKNVEGLQYADLDLTRNLPTDKKNVIHHPDQETTYSSIQLQPQQI